MSPEKKRVTGKRLGAIATSKRMMAQIPHLVNYLALPQPPAGPIDVTSGVTNWPMFLNNQLGDCTCAAVGHMVEIFGQEVSGTPKMVSDQDVLALYESQGYKPGDPSTDHGADMGSVLAYWKSGQWSPDKILAYSQIDPTNKDVMKLALWLFSGVYLGVDLPLTAENQQVWDVVSADPAQNGPGTWGGHAINGVAIDDDGTISVVTWGSIKKMTWRFWLMYGMESFAVVPADYDAAGDKPVSAGFNEQQLLADMAEIGG